ncbi:MAG: SIMPL domain-containing protein [Pseudomonadota bacterium]
MRFIPLVFLSFYVTLASLAQAETSPGPAQIVVIGTGSVTAVPDQAVITLGARHFGKTAGEALTKTNADTAAILERLQQSGIDARDMQTSSLRLSAVWGEYKRAGDGTPAAPKGFEASNDITVTLRNLNTLGEVLDAVVADGANAFSGFQFGVQNRAPLEARARSAAVADAMAKAESYARDAGVTLGAVRLITEDLSLGSGFPPAVAEMAMARSGGVPVAQGEITVSAHIKMVFAAEGAKD